MAWNTPKIDWAASDGVSNVDFNRIEENTRILSIYGNPFGVTTGAVNAYEVTPTPTVQSLELGMRITIRAHVTNTGASTINVAGLGIVPLLNLNGSILRPGAIVANGMYALMYNGTGFYLSSADASTLGGLSNASFVRTDAASTIEQQLFRVRTPDGTLVSNTSQINSLQIYQHISNADALMTFHINGDYAVHFGLSSALNDLVIGGWNLGTNYYRVWHGGTVDKVLLNEIAISGTTAGGASKQILKVGSDDTVSVGSSDLPIALRTNDEYIKAMVNGSAEKRDLVLSGYVLASFLQQADVPQSGIYTVNDGTDMGLLLQWYHVINMHHKDNNGYNAQIAAGLSENRSLLFRAAAGGTWGRWNPIHHGLVKVPITIPTIGWTTSGNADFPYQLTFWLTGADSEAADRVEVDVALASIKTAKRCGLASYAQEVYGAVVFYAKRIPTLNISAEYTLTKGGMI